MDNRTIDVVSEGMDALEHAMRIIWDNAPGGKARFYKVMRLRENVRYCGKPKTTHHFTHLEESEEGTDTLILLWEGDDRIDKALPYEMDFDDAMNFVKGWLKHADYKEQPDHDGDNEKGWRLFTEAWGHVAGEHYAICAIQPVWAMYGK